MSDSDLPLNRCFGLFSARKASRIKRRTEPSITAEVPSHPPKGENEKVSTTLNFTIQLTMKL